MYDINDIISMVIDHANFRHISINQFDMQYILLIINRIYKKTFGEYLFENTSTADPRNPKSYLTAFPEVRDRFMAYGGIDINGDISKDANVCNLPVNICHRVRYMTDILLGKKADDRFYLKKLADKHMKEELKYIEGELNV